MELFGGLMVMMSILFFFLSVIWFVLPFVIFSMKGKVDRSLEVLEGMERRLAALEGRLSVPPVATGDHPPAVSPHTPPSGAPPPVDGE
jgi:hypothetical protein